MKTLTIFFILCSVVANAKDHDITRASANHFLENKGQVTDQYKHSRADIDFVIPVHGMTVFIGDGQMHYQFSRVSAESTSPQATNYEEITGSVLMDMYRMDIELIGANKSAIVLTEDKQQYYEKYYLPQFEVHGGVAHSYSKVTYKEIYPGIDWVLYIKNGHLEYEFVVKENGDPADIQLKYGGSTSLHLNAAGRLTAHTPLGMVAEEKPYSYQEDGKEVASAFKVQNNIVSFEVGPYKGKLVIDPLVEWSTFFGGNSVDHGRAVAVDAAGNAYITGVTYSGTNVATTGSFQQTLNWVNDAYIAKFDSFGTLQWATYYGGDSIDMGYTIASDGNDIYIAGSTKSITVMGTPGSHRENALGDVDLFLARFDNAGNRIWGTYYGGDQWEQVLNGLICDNGGNIYMAGHTKSDTGISTAGSHQPLYSDSTDAFLVKFNSAGVRQWATYYGDTDQDVAHALYIDGPGDIYVSGHSASAVNIATPGSHQPVKGNETDGFLVKFNALGQRLWCTYYGGDGFDNGKGVAGDGTNIYLFGATSSLNDISTPGSFQEVYGGGSHDGYLAKFNGAGQRQWGTYFGGHLVEGDGNITTDDAGNIYMVQTASSDTGMTTDCAYQEDKNALEDILISRFNSQGERQWSTYFGGNGQDYWPISVYDGYGHIYMSGSSSSTDVMATPGAYQEVIDGGVDGFLSRLKLCDAPALNPITGNATACPNNTTLYVISPIACYNTFTWTLPTGWTGASTSDSIWVVPNSNGVISVSVVNSCGIAESQALSVTMYPAVNITITFSNGVLIAPMGFASYQWYDSGLPIPGASFSNYTPTGSGSFYCVVSDGICEGQSNTILNPLSVIDNRSVERNPVLYPNPNNGSFMVSFASQQPGVTIEISDMVGKVIMSKKADVQKGFVNETITLDALLPVGTYLLNVVEDGIGYSVPFVKR